MANERVSGGTGIAPVIDLAALLGGTKTKQSVSADTSQLQALLSQLQGTDYAEVMKSMMTAAAGQIPEIQARFGNAIGGRSGGTPATAQLERLYGDALARANLQVAQLNQNNQNMQLQAAGKIADSTRSATTQQGTNLTRATGALAALQAGSKIYNSELFKKGAEKVSEFGNDLFSGNFSLPTADLSGFGSAVADSLSSGISSAATTASAAYDWISEVGSDIWDYGASFFDGYAEGGLVERRAPGGRGSSAQQLERPIRDTAQANNAMPQELFPRFDMGLDSNEKSGSTYKSPEQPESTPAGFLDATNGSPIANSLMSSLGKAAVLTVLTGTLPLKPVITSLGGAVDKSLGATDAINKSPDPLGSLLAGGQVLSPEVVSSLGSDNIAAAANAVSTIAGTDALDQLIQMTGGFGTVGSTPGSSSSGSNSDFGRQLSDHLNSNPENNRTGGDPTPSPSDSGMSGYSQGGGVKHPVAKSDTVPAMLTPGEFVLTREAVQVLGEDLLNALNQLGNK